MKKTLILILSLVALASACGSGQPWYLQTCYMGHYGYEYGYIGIYEQAGTTISLWFGSKYCPYQVYR